MVLYKSLVFKDQFFFCKKTFLLLLIVSSGFAYPISPIDLELQDLINKSALKPMEPIPAASSELRELGKQLFSEKELSGPKSISCQSCHDPKHGTSDGLPLSLGLKAIDDGQQRTQGPDGIILKRNSPALFNLGQPEIDTMFWDGRVSLDLTTGIFTTPEEKLNGQTPILSQITHDLTSALAAQTIFPPTNKDEMRGESGNELAMAQDNISIWDGIMLRLMNIPQYQKLFPLAFPEKKNFSMGDVGTALAAFISTTFEATATPYDQYLRGDFDAMTESEKKGLKIFIGKGKCVDCHAGKHLSNFAFQSAGAPQIGTQDLAVAEKGRTEVTQSLKDIYKYKTPPLRNVALTAPYFHDGSMETIEDVVEHYSDVEHSLKDYQLGQYVQSFYQTKLVVDKDTLRQKYRFQFISVGELRKGLKFTPQEKKDLVNFLKNALTDRAYLSRI